MENQSKLRLKWVCRRCHHYHSRRVTEAARELTSVQTWFWFEICCGPSFYLSWTRLTRRRHRIWPCESCSRSVSTSVDFRLCSGCRDLPAVPNHAHTLGFSHAIEFGALLQVLLTSNTLRIAKASFSQRIDITPV
jgi:hypothetical protein